MLSLWEKIFVFMQIFFIVYSSNIAASHRHLCQWQFNSSRYSLINKAKKIYLQSYSFSLKMFAWNNLGFCETAHLPLPNPNETQMLTLSQGRSRRTVIQKPKQIRCMNQYLFFLISISTCPVSGTVSVHQQCCYFCMITGQWFLFFSTC